MRKWVLLTALLALLFAPSLARAEMQKIAENDRYAMYLDGETTNFQIEDKLTGRALLAFPENWIDDALAKGNNKKLISSLVAISVFNPKGDEDTANCRADCLEDGTYALMLIPDGFRLVLDFVKEGVQLELRVTLTESGFSAEVPLERIVESGENKLGSVRVLPFLNAGTVEDEGYIFLPDGSGALIDFDGDFSLKSKVTRAFYGRDLSIMYATLPQPEETATLPVFGIKKNDVSFLAVVRGGVYTSQVEAQAAGDNAEYFRASAVYDYRDQHNIVLFENTANERSIQALSTKPSAEALKVDYLMLEGEEADYSGMARAYRAYLSQRGELTSHDTTPYLDLKLYGAADKRVTTFGVPHWQLTAFTTFDQAREIADRAMEAGSERLNLTLYGFQQGGRKTSITSQVSPASLLGAEQGLKDLVGYAKQHGVGMAVAAELVSVFRDGNGYSAVSDGAHSISDGVAWQYTPSAVDLKRDYSKAAYSLLSPDQLAMRFQTYAASMAEYGLSAAQVEGWGSKVYAQYAAGKYLTRDLTGRMWEKALDCTSVDIVADGGNAYTLRTTDRLIDVAMSDTGLDITTREVPFYQIVVHGSIPYSGTPGNRVADVQKAFLRMMEYGAYPCYEWFYADSAQTQFTCLEDIFSGNYEYWLADAARAYHASLALYQVSEGTPIRRHDRLADDLYATAYENGAMCYVNYGAADAKVDGVTVPAVGYALVGKDGSLCAAP